MFVIKRLAPLFILIIFIICGCKRQPASILLFNGTGTSPNDVRAIAAIFDREHLDYATINSLELNSMSRAQMLAHRLLIIPGGDFINMGKSLSTSTTINISYAVRHGLNYLGICAGAFLAGRSAYYNGFDLASGTTFGFYSAENKGIRKAAVTISYPGAPSQEQYWEDGPQLTGWGNVVAKYPDNAPAITQGKHGEGFVILSGIHAEAQDNWRGGIAFSTSAEDDNAYAAKLIRSALDGRALPHF